MKRAFIACLVAVAFGSVGCDADKPASPPNTAAPSAAPSATPAAAPAAAPVKPPAPVTPDGAALFKKAEGLLHSKGVDLAGAAAAYTEACDAGFGRGCAALGLLVQDGRGVERDIQRATQLYDKACQAGAGVGCFNLGLMALSGNGVARDTAAADGQFARAHTVYTKACDSGDGGACLNLAFLYEQGFGVDKDVGKAKALDDKGCAAGEQDACASAGLLALQGGDKAGITAIEASCKKNSPVGCRILAQIWFRGAHEVEKDVDGALEAAKRGCQLGERSACSFLGALLAQANGPVAQVRPLLERACLLGDSGACLAYASSHKGAPTVAGVWILRACDIGDPEGCLYAAGLPTATPEQSADRIARACQMHFPRACGQMVEAGRPLPMLPRDATTMKKTLCDDGLQAACAR